jgi:hypothetical protein
MGNEKKTLEKSEFEEILESGKRKIISRLFNSGCSEDANAKINNRKPVKTQNIQYAIIEAVKPELSFRKSDTGKQFVFEYELSPFLKRFKTKLSFCHNHVSN